MVNHENPKMTIRQSVMRVGRMSDEEKKAIALEYVGCEGLLKVNGIAFSYAYEISRRFCLGNGQARSVFDSTFSDVLSYIVNEGCVLREGRHSKKMRFWEVDNASIERIASRVKSIRMLEITFPLIDYIAQRYIAQTCRF
jgi:hypothetical protein